MREVTKYVCEICGTEYRFKKDAEKCENFHMLIERVEPRYSGSSGVPYILDVTISNGWVYRYENGASCWDRRMVTNDKSG